MLGQRGFQVAVWCAVIVVALAISAYAVLTGTATARIVDSSPPDGVLAPITAAVRIAFSAPMDRTSVEERLRLDPPAQGDITWNDNTLHFVPRPALTPGTTYTVTLEAGSRSGTGDELEDRYVWQFRTREPRLLYLSRLQPEAEGRQLFVTSLDGEAQALTDHAYGVWDYGAHPLGEQVVYSVLREDGGADLWRMDRDGEGRSLLLACPGAACINPVWSPDGAQLAFEERGIWASAPNLDPEASRIQLLSPESGLERPLFDYDVPAHSPVWSPDGGRLAYVSPLLPGIEVYDLTSEKLHSFGNEWGSAPVWSPDGSALVVPELVLAGEALMVHLYRIDLETGAVADLSGDDEMVKDVAAAWSPAGGWVAFSRQYLDEERWTPGRQLWLARPGGGEAYPLVTDGMGDLFGTAWRPDAGAVTYLRTDLSEGLQPVPRVSVWVLDLADRSPVMMASDGVLPEWLP